MSSRYSYGSSPVIHQGGRDSSVSSTYTRSSLSPSSSTSNSGSSTPRSMRSNSPTEAREYGAAGHMSNMAKRNNVVVINRNEAGYDKHAPQPSYNPGYAPKRSQK